MAALKHELWRGADGSWTFCLAGPMGNAARRVLEPGAGLIWTVEANSYFEAMTRYYEFMGWGEYQSDEDSDRDPYPDAWLAAQRT